MALQWSQHRCRDKPLPAKGAAAVGQSLASSRQAAPSEGSGRCRAQLYDVATCRSQQRGRPLSGTKVSARALRKRGCRAPGDLTPCLNGDVFIGDTLGHEYGRSSFSRYAAPAPVMEFIVPALAVSAAPAPVVVHIAPEPAATYAAQAPVVECFTPASAVTSRQRQ